MDYSSATSLPTETEITDKQKVEDDLKYCEDDEESQLQVINTAYRPDVERLPSFTEVSWWK